MHDFDMPLPIPMDEDIWVARRNGGLTRLTVDGDSVQASPQPEPSKSIQDTVYSVYREPNGTMF
jgi:hypothetical protein